MQAQPIRHPLPNVVAARLTPGHIIDILNRHPVGTQQQRDRWHTDLTHLHDGQHYPNEGHKGRFTQIRNELRAAYLPLNRRHWITRLFNNFGITVELISYQDRLPLSDRSSQNLIDQVVLPFGAVPDLVLEQLLIRHGDSQDPNIQSALNGLVKTDPLRFSSELGVLHYLGIFESEPFKRQSQMLTQLLEAGQQDGRVIPMITAIAEHHLDVFRAEHMESLLKLTNTFPALSQIWAHFERRDELFTVALKRAFNSNGILLVKPETVTSLWKIVGPKSKLRILAQFRKVVVESKKAKWRDYSILNHLSPNTFVFQEDVDPQKIGNNFSNYSTPVLVDLMLYLFQHGTSDAHRQKSVAIQDFLVRNRLHHFRSDLAIFHSQLPGVKEYLEPISERVSSRVMGQIMPEN